MNNTEQKKASSMTSSTKLQGQSTTYSEIMKRLHQAYGLRNQSTSEGKKPLENGEATKEGNQREKLTTQERTIEVTFLKRLKKD